MKYILRAALLLWILLCGILPLANAQIQAAPKVAKILIEHAGPRAVSDSLVRANIRTKVGEPFSRAYVDEDIKNLYATGFFANIRVSEKTGPDGMTLTYIVQGKPILTDLKLVGNKKYSTSKLMKKVTSKIGEPLDERKLFSDAQEIQKFYEKSGYQKTKVKVLPPSVDPNTGRGTVTIEIQEAPKIYIKDIIFDNVTDPEITQRKLRKELKTKRRWMFSWLTGSGVLKDEEFQDDKDRLIEYFQNQGYIDAVIKDVKFVNVSPKKIIIHFDMSQGRKYKVGTIEFNGNKLYSTNDFLKGLKIDGKLMKIEMVPGETFTPIGLTKDTDTLKDFYGSKGYIDSKIVPTKVPNPSTGTMDLRYDIQEGDKSYIEKIEIKGNVKTKDRVLRRELAVAPGEVYDMVRVKLSKERLEGLQYFEKIDTQPEETDVPGRKNLVIGVEEKNTGSVMLGAGVSSVDSVVGFVEFTQGNFDLFKPPTFTGAGQKLRLRTQIGTVRQDYEMSFIEPWFLGRKLALGVDFYYRDLGYLSLNDLYSETIVGSSVSLTRALGSDFLIGRVSYTIEDIDLRINSGYHTNTALVTKTVDGKDVQVNEAQNISHEIYDERGERLVSKFGTSLAYDTRNKALLPDRGQRTELLTEFAGAGGDTKFYKLEARSSWYFKGFMKDHVFELAGRTGVVDTWGDEKRVPLFDRYYLGGLYSLRGYKFRQVGPRDIFNEPLGGNTYWFGTAEYSVPIIERVRFALFYDIGNVYRRAYSYSLERTSNEELKRSNFYNDNWGVGLRLNLPIGPLRLDYGIPIKSDVGGSGRFQFGVGYTREF